MTTNSKQRLLSLDTLRGFDMIWIVGGAEIFHALSEHTPWHWAAFMSEQMHHTWVGFHLFDLIFPLFMFISGAAIPYAIFSKLERGVPKKDLYRKVIIRAVLLSFFGLVYNGFFQFEFATLRYPSVLAQIGIAYLIAACIAINFQSIRAIAFWILGILLAYSALQLFVPVPGHGAGVFSGDGIINGYIDRFVFSGHTLGQWGDPEGLLCIISGASLTLMGIVAGIILRSGQAKPIHKAGILAGIGGVALLLTLTIEPFYPIIKAFWTTTYDLLAGGLSFLLLALFYLIIDVWKCQKWTFFFRVIGLNSITIYLANRMIDFEFTSNYLFGGIANASGQLGPSMLMVGVIVLEWLLLFFLYKKNVFLKV